MNKLNDFLRPESMLTGNFIGGAIAGIGAAFESSLGWPNGYIMLFFALLFGANVAMVAAKAAGKWVFILYLLLGAGLGMWEAVQSGTYIESKVEIVSAQDKDKVFVDRAGMYVAVRVTVQGIDEHRAPAWAVEMYCEQVNKDTGFVQKQSPWKIRF